MSVVVLLARRRIADIETFSIVLSYKLSLLIFLYAFIQDHSLPSNYDLQLGAPWMESCSCASCLGRSQAHQTAGQLFLCGNDCIVFDFLRCLASDRFSPARRYLCSSKDCFRRKSFLCWLYPESLFENASMFCMDFTLPNLIVHFVRTVNPYSYAILLIYYNHSSSPCWARNDKWVPRLFHRPERKRRHAGGSFSCYKQNLRAGGKILRYGFSRVS